MRYLTADIIYPLHRAPIKEGVLVVAEDGSIVDLLETREGIADLEIFEGFLCPGFVNTHCHLELSHMLGKLPQQTGLPDFISKVPKEREAMAEQIQEAIIKADALMQANGIVAVGDIANTVDTFSLKEKSTIHYHTFIELFAIDSQKAEVVFKNGLELQVQCQTANSLVPHATYSVSEKLFELIRENNKGEIVCMHNQETATEDELFKKGSGTMYEQLKAFGELPMSGQSALRTALPQLPHVPTLLVHNTYTSHADVQWAEEHYANLFWCACPQANLYIEGRLPNYQHFEGANMTIGTDSLASNHTLSIWEEIQTLRKHTGLDLNTLLVWACKNGAEFLQLAHLGTFEKGKKPGINCVNNGKLLSL
jgi:aminodeoxyfutalosine deaminase